MGKELFEKPEIRIQNLSQGMYDGKFYYGKVVRIGEQKVDTLILSSRVCLADYSEIRMNGMGFGQNEITDAGFHYRHGLMEMPYRWSNHSAYSFLNGDSLEVNPKILFNRIREVLEYYMDVHDERILDLIAVYILGTYCYSLFNSYGYLFFNCERESGKTKLMMLIELMCFNPVNATNPSESALFRACEYTKPTLLIDDYEKIEDEKQKIINQILKVGYKKGGQTIRTEKRNGKYEPVLFDVYSPKVISNTGELDSITLTRCIVLRLLKTKTEKGKLEPVDMDPKWQDIRDQGYLFTMQHWAEILQNYREYHSGKFNNRNLELVKGTLAIAKLIDDGLHDKIEDFLAETFTDRDLQIQEGDWEFTLFQRIGEQVTAERHYAVSEISEWCVGHIVLDSTKPGSLPRWIGKKLSKVPIFKKRHMAQGMEYYLSPSIVRDYLERRGHSIPPTLTALTEPLSEGARRDKCNL